MNISFRSLKVIVLTVVTGTAVFLGFQAFADERHHGSPDPDKSEFCIHIPNYFAFGSEWRLKLFLRALARFNPAGDQYYIVVHKADGKDVAYGLLKPDDFCCKPADDWWGHGHIRASVQVTQHINISRKTKSKRSAEALGKLIETLQKQ